MTFNYWAAFIYTLQTLQHNLNLGSKFLSQLPNTYFGTFLSATKLNDHWNLFSILFWIFSYNSKKYIVPSF